MSARQYDIEFFGLPSRIWADDAVMEEDYRNGRLHEHQMLAWIHNNVPSGGIWIDAGANIGNHSMAFALKASEVLAFEPAPNNFELLERNVQGLNNVLPIRLGLASCADLLKLTPTAQGRNSQFALQPGTGPNVMVAALDDLVPRNAKVGLIKIDVEGMEEAVIAGAMAIIARQRPEIFVEVWHQNTLDFISDRLLGRMGYQLIECWNDAPTFHFSASGRYPVTYKHRELQ